MSKRALEFVENWVSDKIRKEGIPEEGEQSPAKEWAQECTSAANDEGIPATEINEAFDDLAEFIEGEIEEAGERDEEEDDEEDDEDEEEEDEDEEDDEEEDEDEEDDEGEEDDEEEED